MKPRSYGPFPYSPIIDRPKLEWPNGAHVALWIIPNIEYFSMMEKPGGYGAGAKLPDVVMWSERDYGNRVGVFRIMDTLDKYGIRGTVALNSNLCAEHPRIMGEGEKRKWEWMGHNESNTRRLNEAGPGEEAQVVRNTFATIKQHTGDLDRVQRVLRLFGMVNCSGEFAQMPQVIDGASDLFFELWGPEHGKHARTAVGQVSLPRGIAVEINGEFELAS